ncbi:dynamin family protein [Seiridium cupressi]
MSKGEPTGFIDASLLEKIDKLFACNVGDYVDLPQLVVVGHQSSGKSSVLEGLTGLPFLRDKELCTRFATQITFRRSPVTEIKVSIIPAKDSSIEHKLEMKKWTKNMDTFDVALFAEIMADAIQVMGIGGDIPGPAFSKDVLVLEVAGPSQEHFSVIDVPGTFKRTTQGITTKDDIALVMLVVVPCNVDIATQEIIELAEDLDPEGNRTLGVLTKPDLVDKGTESIVIDLIEDRRQRLKLGWHLLRNPGQAELEDNRRSRNDIEQSFFNNTQPWTTLDKEKVGIVSLRLRLQCILAAHLRREFPKVKAEISQALAESTKKLQLLGPKRQNQSEQTQFLMDLTLGFQETVEHALRSEYAQADFFDGDMDVCLATAVVNRGEKFSELMATQGHAYSFDEPKHVQKIPVVDWEHVDPALGETFCVRLTASGPNIDDVVHPNVILAEPKSGGMLTWLQLTYQQSRGFELGSFNPQVLALIMKQQAQKWSDIALGYVSDVISLVHSFIMKLLRFVAPNDRVRDELVSVLMDQLTEQYRHAVSHTKFLLEVELQGRPATYNHYFADALEKCRQERMRSQLAAVSFNDCSHGEVVRLADIVQNHSSGNAEHTVREIHDILRSYYNVARKRFVDNVRMQVADHFLVTGPSAPLKVFSPTFVSTLSAAQLDSVAGEELAVRRQRRELEKRMELLEEGRRILR